MRFLRWSLLAVMGFVLVACNGNGGQVAPSPTPTPEPGALLEEAAQLIREVETFGVTIQVEGAPVFVDSAGLINFVRAVGYFVAPDAVQAQVRALVLGIAGDVDVIAIGDDQYYRHTVLTGGQWLHDAFSPGFNAETFVRSNDGLPRALEALNDIILIGLEDLNGIPVWHMTGTAIGSEVNVLTFGLIAAAADVLVDIYIRTDDGYPEQLVIVQPDTVSEDEPDPTTWTIELYDYNSDEYVIGTPENVIEPPPTPTPEPTEEGGLPDAPGS